MERGGESRDGGRDARAWHDGEPGGSTAWRRSEPVIHLAASGGARRADGCRRGGGSCAGVRLSRAPGAVARDAAAPGQEDDGGGNPQGGAGSRRSKKAAVARALVKLGRWPMRAVCEALGVARSNIAASFQAPLAKPKAGPGRPPADDGEL